MLKFAPELDKRIRPFLHPTNDSWRVDETDIEIKGTWKYLYRAVDSQGNTRSLHAECEAEWEGCCPLFRKVLGAEHTQTPRVNTVDKNAAYRVAMDELKQDQTLKAQTELRQSKYLNN
ncbi:DDE-type integrase/transposase/recombinase, partial [Phormidium tenue FACHB-886]|nr:DDE-type integrase/transposase/recombinase [Phormidium tenue FACHB-886]